MEWRLKDGMFLGRDQVRKGWSALGAFFMTYDMMLKWGGGVEGFS